VRRRLLRASLAAPALVLLAACSRGPGGDDYFPLAAGHAWTYVVTTAFDDSDSPPQREDLTLYARGADAFDGAPAWRRHSDSGVDYWLRSDDSGIYRVASKGPTDNEPRSDNPRRYVLQRPFVVGTQWEATTTAYALQRRNEVPREIRYTHKPFPMLYRIDAVEQEVQTPAGRFKGCLRVAGRALVRLYVDAMFAWRDVPLTSLEWYCPGVGLVRLERKEPTPSKFMVGGSVTLELASWQ